MAALAWYGMRSEFWTWRRDCGTSFSLFLRTLMARSTASMDSERSVFTAMKSACSLSRMAVASAASFSLAAMRPSSSSISPASSSASASALAMSAVSCSICAAASSMAFWVLKRVSSHQAWYLANSTSSWCFSSLPFASMSLSISMTFWMGVTDAPAEAPVATADCARQPSTSAGIMATRIAAAHCNVRPRDAADAAMFLRRPEP
mmetsp:Transcript_69486/g.203948  ORF Transcript_69486/g.203948 Transcript_69486/m.203948 type:complete len:205 (+) Transcript_69486:382-996(+)